MAHQFTGYSTADMYQSVINDVFSSMKEVFLDDDVEIDVLVQIKKAWEQRIEETCLFDRKPQGHTNFNVVLPQQRSDTPVGRFGVSGIQMLPPFSDYPIANVNSPQVYQMPEMLPVQQQEQQYYQMPLHQQQSLQLMQPKQEVHYYSGNYGVPQHEVPDPQNLVPVTSQVQYVTQGGMIYQNTNSPLRPLQPVQTPVQRAQILTPQQPALVQQDQGLYDNQQYVQPVHNTQQAQRVIYRPIHAQQFVPQQQPISLPQSGQQFTTSGGAQFVYFQSSDAPSPPPAESQGENKPTIPHSSMYQLDGNVCREYLKDGNKKTKTAECPATRNDAECVLAQLGMLQLDGGGAGMSDSSSDEDEDMCPLRRLADKVGGDGIIEDTEEIVEEEALNSDDDDDDDDLDKLFDVDNTIICQFEKVHRARNKWKLHLKDGIMHIDDRDHCFNRATGEAEF